MLRLKFHSSPARLTPLCMVSSGCKGQNRYKRTKIGRKLEKWNVIGRREKNWWPDEHVSAATLLTAFRPFLFNTWKRRACDMQNSLQDSQTAKHILHIYVRHLTYRLKSVAWKMKRTQEKWANRNDKIIAHIYFKLKLYSTNHFKYNIHNICITLNVWCMYISADEKMSSTWAATLLHSPHPAFAI